MNAKVRETSQEQNQSRVGQQNYCSCKGPECHRLLKNVLSHQVRRDIAQCSEVTTPFYVVREMCEIPPLLNYNLVEFFNHVNTYEDYYNKRGSC